MDRPLSSSSFWDMASKGAVLVYGETRAEDEEDEGEALSQGEAVWLLNAI